jgi:3-methylfumaryl-CoA hydratase
MTEGRVTTDTLSVERARALAATLDLAPASLREGDPLPAGWHWIYFHEAATRSELGEDGHEARGEFLPKVALPHRMWAGGRLRFHHPLRLGERVRRVSVVDRIEPKQGRSGRLVFVTVRHCLHDARGAVAIEDEQDLVYLERRAGGERSVPRSEVPDFVEPFVADEVMLFRFSALTFNGHRIHYDRRYATEVEGYADLVVQGPLLALLLLGAGVGHARATLRTDPTVRGFSYRAMQPVFCDEPFAICGRRLDAPPHGVDLPGAPNHSLWIEHAQRGVAMRATLTSAV